MKLYLHKPITDHFEQTSIKGILEGVNASYITLKRSNMDIFSGTTPSSLGANVKCCWG